MGLKEQNARLQPWILSPVLPSHLTSLKDSMTTLGARKGVSREKCTKEVQEAERRAQLTYQPLHLPSVKAPQYRGSPRAVTLPCDWGVS